MRGRGSAKKTAFPGTISCPAASPSPLKLMTAVLLLALLLLPSPAAAQSAGQTIVQAILFYSPTCPHCHQVINDFLIPMQEQYGEQLQIIGLDTTHPAGSALYGGAIERFEIPQDRLGVPTLIVGDTVLVGGAEIPARFPALVEDGLSAGGIGWPEIPGLAIAIPDLPPPAGPDAKPAIATPITAESEDIPQEPEPIVLPTAVPSGQDMSLTVVEETAPTIQSLENTTSLVVPSESEVPPADPIGFNLARLVLIGMVIALIYTALLIIWRLPSPAGRPFVARNLSWAILALALIGLAVALYLSYVEVARVEAVCRPVGECNIVQSSPYAQLMGIPVAVLGTLSYTAIIGLWIGQRSLSGRLSLLALLGLVFLTIFGVIFSLYLTLLELLVIGAVCAWCLSSAIVMTLLMILVAKSLFRGSAQTKLVTQMVAK
jgi:uncharacterized membrane protein